MNPGIAYIVTSPLSANVLLRGQLRALSMAGFDVTVLSAPSPELEEVAHREGVRTAIAGFEREIRPLKDMRALAEVRQILNRTKPEIVNASTPKAGLLGMIAAWQVGIPVRIYQQRGLRLETAAGVQRKVLLWLEKTAAACAHHVVCNSHSLRSRCIELGIASPDKLSVLGAGSSNGVDAERFHPTQPVDSGSERLRADLGLGNGPVIGFVGRLTRDKGIEELVKAFELILNVVADAQLLLVGPFEEGDPISSETRSLLQNHPHITITGYVSDTAPYYRVMDVLAFLSYREGFPNVPLEAAASGIPVVGYRATGTVDAVVDGETGILVDVGDIEGLTANLERLLKDANARVALGMRGRQRAVEQFASEIVWKNWAQYYRGMLASRRDV